MSLTTVLANPTLKPIYLAEVTAGKTYAGWADQHTDNAARVAEAGRVTAVKFNGATLSEKTTAADCGHNPFTWAQPDDGYLYVNISKSFEIGTTSLAAASHEYWSRAASTNFDVPVGNKKFYIRGWFMPASANTNAGLATRSSLGSTHGDWAVGFFNGVSMKPTFRVNGLAATLQSTTELVADTWYYIECCYDGTKAGGLGVNADNMQLFIDGVKDCAAAYSADVNNTGSTIALGIYYDTNYEINGKMFNWEFKLGDHGNWSDAAAGATVYTPPVVMDISGSPTAFWKFDDGSGTTAADSSGNSYTLTGTNTPGWSTATWSTTYASPLTDGNTVLAMVGYNFSNRAKVLNSLYWDPRLKDLPRISVRVERDFNGIGQIGGGTITFSNYDGYFDDLTDYCWDAGTTTIWMGADTDSATMTWGDYEKIATFTNEAWQKDNKKFTLELSELKAKLKKDFPFDVYQYSDYPAMAPGDLGKIKQIAYGKILGATPVCIDTASKKFKVANHPIKSFDAVRVSTGNGWVEKGFTTTDLEHAWFTYSGWDGSSSISVDFTGRVDDNGLWMNNASDIVKDILAKIGQTDIDTTSFTTAKTALEVGYQGPQQICRSVPSLYLSEPQDAYDIISNINQFVGSYLFVGTDGKYKYQVFEPTPGEDLTHVEDADLISFQEIIESGREKSSVTGKFANRISEGWGESVHRTETKNQYKRDEPCVVYECYDAPTESQSDAAAWIERILVTNGNPAKIYKITVKWIGFTLRAAGQIRLTETRHDIDEILEVLEITYNFTNSTVDMVLGNLHNFEDHTGFWVADAAVVPTRYADDAGYAAGVLDWNGSESADLATWKRQNVGFWCDTNGFALTADPRSFYASTWF